ncbi:MAG: extracellular solute-binding protein, partial [Muribaculaceae bacterium]|nr:extracellular solute-binding protein [Muribaculaceae bacterium]
MKKKLLSAILCTAMVASVLTGCGGSSSDGGAASAPADDAAEAETPAAEPEAEEEAEAPAASTDGEEVTLTVLAGQSTTDAGIEDMIDEALAAQYPNITLEWECTGWDGEFHPKMQQYMQSGLPDIIIGKAQDVATYASQGVLGEIDSTYLDRGLDAARENVTFDGKTYGLVYNAQYQGVYYNKAMFEENGWSIPATQDELQAIIDDCNAKGIVPFASHMVDTWSIGNVTMQFMMNDVFNTTPDWGDKFRAGEVSFSDDEAAQTAYSYNKLIYDNTYPETFSTEQTDCDARMVLGEAAMKV